MNSNLSKFLNNKNCFKLICGAGNQNLEEIARLVAVYAAAGCRFFDLAADENVLLAAKKGLDYSVPKEKQKDYNFCISIGMQNDQHTQKAVIENEKCSACMACMKICPQNAIQTEADKFKVIEKNCIGCMKCQKVCPNSAISYYSSLLTPQSLSGFLMRMRKNSKNDSFLRFFKSDLRSVRTHISCGIAGGMGASRTRELARKIPNFSASSMPNNSNSVPLSCIELHASDENEKEADEIWDYLNENFNGILSLCISRKKLSDEQILARVKRLVQKRKPYTTIIQADGNPMSGGKDDFETTLLAVETGKLIQSADLPVYLFLSGGTNSKTAQLAKLKKLDITGVAIGSFARKAVKKYIEQKDFWQNGAVFEEASKTARKLVEFKSF